MFSLAKLTGLAFGLAVATDAAAQVPLEILARARVFPELGAGVTAIRARGAGAERRYFVLAPMPGATRPEYRIQVFDPAGKRAGCIPACPNTAPPSPTATSPSPNLQKAGEASSAALFSGDDFDISAEGQFYVAERGANAILVLTSEGTRVRTISIAAPTSVAALGAGEVAVSSMRTPKLVTVFNAEGKVAREFGDPTEVSERPELNRFLQIGRVASDPADHIYYSFSYLPEPTVRKYDRFGYALVQVEQAVPEFQPAARAARREIARQTTGGGAPSMKAVITAIGVDAETQEIWVAIGSELLKFDAEGIRRGAWRTFTAEGGRLDTSAILV